MHVEVEPSIQTRVRMTSSLHLNFANYWLFVCTGGLWKAVECVMLHGCVIHVELHGEIMLWLADT